MAESYGAAPVPRCPKCGETILTKFWIEDRQSMQYTCTVGCRYTWVEPRATQAPSAPIPPLPTLPQAGEMPFLSNALRAIETIRAGTGRRPPVTPSEIQERKMMLLERRRGELVKTIDHGRGTVAVGAILCLGALTLLILLPAVIKGLSLLGVLAGGAFLVVGRSTRRAAERQRDVIDTQIDLLLDEETDDAERAERKDP